MDFWKVSQYSKLQILHCPKQEQFTSPLTKTAFRKSKRFTKFLFTYQEINRSSHTKVSVKRCSQKEYLFIKKESLAQMFSCGFYEISKNTFFTEHLWWLLLNKAHPEIRNQNISSCLPSFQMVFVMTQNYQFIASTKSFPEEFP